MPDFAHPAETVPQARNAGRPATAARAALTLQRQAGNRAVGRWLSRAPQLPAAADEPTWRPHPTDLLTVAERQILRKEAVFQLGTAFTIILRELDHVVASVHAQEKAREDWAVAVIDIFFGLASPALAKLLTARGGKLAKLGKKAEETLATTDTLEHAKAAEAAAEAAAKAESAAASAAKARGVADELGTAKRTAEKAAKADKALTGAAIKARKEWSAASKAAGTAQHAAGEAQAAAQKAAEAHEKLKPTKLISDAEVLKEGMKGVGKVISTEAKHNLAAVFGEDHVDVFARGLATQLQQAVNEVARALIEDGEKQPDGPGEHFSDPALIAVWAAYHEDVANPEMYLATLKALFDDYMKFVKPIRRNLLGTPNTRGKAVSDDHERAVWVSSAAGKRLWLVRDEFRDGERFPTFIGVVPADKVAVAVAGSKQREGREPETVDESLLRTLERTHQAPTAGDPPVADVSGLERNPDLSHDLLSGSDTRVVWVQSKAGKRLWLVKDAIREGVSYPTFVAPVPDALVAVAAARNHQNLGAEPETVDESVLRTLQQTRQAPKT